MELRRWHSWMTRMSMKYTYYHIHMYTYIYIHTLRVSWNPTIQCFCFGMFWSKTVLAFVLLLRRSCGAMFPNVARLFLACVSTKRLELHSTASRCFLGLTIFWSHCAGQWQKQHQHVKTTFFFPMRTRKNWDYGFPCSYAYRKPRPRPLPWVKSQSGPKCNYWNC